MNKRYYGPVLLNPAPIENPYDIFMADYARCRPRREGKLVGYCRCGRTQCTLYGRGDKKLCKECKTK